MSNQATPCTLGAPWVPLAHSSELPWVSHDWAGLRLAVDNCPWLPTAAHDWPRLPLTATCQCAYQPLTPLWMP
jgi:hypothetical protein